MDKRSYPSSSSPSHVLEVSRLVLDMVVRPGWLDNDRKREHKVCRNTDLFRVGEAMFPLVGVVCSRAIALGVARRENRYYAITSAASVPAPRCVAWLINNRDWCFHKNTFGRRVLLQPTPSAAVTAAATETEGTISSHHRGVATRDCCGVGVVVEEQQRRDWGESLSAVKEVVAALMGLCIGGHLLMAKAMLGFGLSDGAVTNGGQCLWDGWGVFGWGLLNKEVRNGLRERVIEYVREDCGKFMFLERLCGTGGNLDVVKWFVDEVMGGVEHGNETTLRLVLHEPLKTCLGRGNMEVFKWLFDKLEMGAKPLAQPEHKDLFFACAFGECPGNFKWCLENLQVGNSKETLVRILLKNRHATVKDFQWLEGDICEHGLSGWYLVFEAIRKVDVAKWLLTLLPSNRLDEHEFNCLCKNTGDTEFVEWLINAKNCTPTTESFVSACSTSAKHESDIIHSLVQALRWNNIEVAEWLEGTFHVMQSINSNPEIAGNALEELCEGCPQVITDRLDGLKWFIKHLSSPSSLKMSSIHNAVSRALTDPLPDTAAFVLESFPQFDPHVDQALLNKVTLAFMKFNQSALTKLVYADGSSLLTPESAAQCLTSSDFYPFSSKTVKWVIRRFNLQYDHIRANNNLLLFKLLSWKKNGCAQWLLDSFDIPLNDVTEMARTCTEFNCLDLVGWKLLERHFYPKIDAAMIRSHFIPMLSKSPHVAIHTIHSFGITLNEFHAFVKTQSIYRVSEATKIWLGMIDPHSLL
ncbi:hypothetical protein Pelo_15086 [Pelomyxa schiedti]|nr:hypothetical protein Pelo_15086 [Pelomyxa schiedti]